MSVAGSDSILGWDASDDDAPLAFALERMRAGEKVALITLAKIEGSSPRPLGAQMAATASGRWVGYLSGGCVEGAIAAEAQAAIAEGRSRRVRFGRGSPFFDIRLPCGGAIEVVIDVDVSPDALADVAARLRMRLPTTLDVPSLTGERLTRLYQPRRRLVVAGVGPAAVRLAQLAGLVGYEVVVLSPDGATRAAAAALGVETIALVGAATPLNLGADARAAIVFTFHDHEWERDLLPLALATDAFYIGAMGSGATHRLRVRRLQEQGFAPAAIARIRGPAGLFAGAKSAADIALSILAEIAEAAQSEAAPLLEGAGGALAAAE